MERIDNKIIGGVEIINKLLKENESRKPEGYFTKTNLKFDGVNLRTLDIDSLLAAFVKVDTEYRNWKATIESNTDIPFPELDSIKYGDSNFTMTEYKNDIAFLIETKKYNETKAELESKLAKIQSKHSQEFKDNEEVDNIIKGLI